MTSCSSHGQPESMHPYHTDHQQSTTSLSSSQSVSRRTVFSRLKVTFQREDLLSLPENISLSSFSCQALAPAPPALPPMLYVVQTPIPLSGDDLEKQLTQFQLGSSYFSRPPTPQYYAGCINHNGDPRAPAAPPMPFNPDEFWDNLTILISTYFLPGRYKTLPTDYPIPKNYLSIIHWDQPVQNYKLMPEPEPVTGPSWPPQWQIVIDHDLPLNQFGKSVRFRQWPSETDSDTAMEQLPAWEHINRIYGESLVPTIPEE